MRENGSIRPSNRCGRTSFCQTYASHLPTLEKNEERNARPSKSLKLKRQFVRKTIEHQPTLIRDGLNPPYVNHRGAPHLNTFLVFVPTIVVPAGFTRDGLPAGISFLGRPYDDGKMIRLAYSYEQATHHRRPPASTS